MTTGTISFSDIKNKAEYDSKGYGVGASVANANDETISAGGPSVSVPAHDEAENTTNSAVAKGKINITWQKMSPTSVSGGWDK